MSIKISTKMRISLREDIKEEVKKNHVGKLSTELNVTPKAIYGWLYRDSDMLTLYSTLLALKKLLKKPINDLINIERC